MSASHRPYPRVYPALYWGVRGLMRALVWLLTSRVVVEGASHIPATGPFMLATNHLSYLDSPLMFVAVPRIMYFLAGEKYASHLFFGLILRVGGAIFVQRGEVDRAALRQASAALRDGNCLTVAVEGTRSKTGALIPGKTGAAYLATRENALIVPAAIWGSEQIGPAWKKLQRARVHIRFGEPFRLPEGRARAEALDAHTDEIMTTIAAMLPEGYRGAYRDHPLLREKLSPESLIGQSAL